MRYLYLLVSLLVFAHDAFAEDRYETYYNSRYNYSISYPRETLFPQGESDNGDGQTFLSRDGQARLSVYGSENIFEQSLEELFREESRGGQSDDLTRVVTYKVLKKDWFVISGLSSGKVFYKKTILRNGRFKSFLFEYPETQKNIFNAVTTRLASSFNALEDKRVVTVPDAPRSVAQGNSPEPSSESPYPRISMEDLKTDIKEMLGKKVSVSALAQTVGQLFLLKSDLMDMTPIVFDIDTLPREDRKKLVNSCQIVPCRAVFFGTIKSLNMGIGLRVEKVIWN